MNILLIIILIVLIFLAGFVVGFFVMRNNPKYFNIDKMLKRMSGVKKAEFIAYVKNKFGL